MGRHVLAPRKPYPAPPSQESLRESRLAGYRSLLEQLEERARKEREARRRASAPMEWCDYGCNCADDDDCGEAEVDSEATSEFSSEAASVSGLSQLPSPLVGFASPPSEQASLPRPRIRWAAALVDEVRHVSAPYVSAECGEYKLTVPVAPVKFSKPWTSSPMPSHMPEETLPQQLQVQVQAQVGSSSGDTNERQRRDADTLDHMSHADVAISTAFSSVAAAAPPNAAHSVVRNQPEQPEPPEKRPRLMLSASMMIGGSTARRDGDS